MLARKFEWHAPFFLLAGLSVPILALAVWVLPRLHAQHAPAHPWTQMTAILSDPINQRGFMLSAVLIFGGSCIVPYLAPSMVANVGLTEAQLPLIYLAGGIATLITTPIIGRLSDRHDKLHVLSWLTAGAIVVVLVMTNLPPAPVAVAMIVTALFMVTMSGRFSPSMAMITNAVSSRYRGGFMSVNSAVQQASSGIATFAGSLLVTRGVNGRLEGYPIAGIVAVAFFVGTVFLAARLRAIAPHAAKTIAPSGIPVPAAE